MKTIFFAMCMTAVMMALGCGSAETTGGSGSTTASTSGSGGTDTTVGKSPAIEAFQASRRATQQDPQILVVLDAQTGTAAMVSIAPSTEAARVQSVIDWTLDVYCRAWATHAGVTWAPSAGTHSPAQAGFESAAFQAATQAARDALPVQSWEAEWAGFEAGFEAAEAGVPGIPAEWTEERKGMLQGALDAAYIGAVKSGAADIAAALASIGPIGGELFAAENDEFAALVAHP